MNTSYYGEIIALIVAFSWTATALFAETANKRLGSLPLKLIRMVLSWAFLSIMLWIATGTPYPMHASSKAWFWLALSGLVGPSLVCRSRSWRCNTPRPASPPR